MKKEKKETFEDETSEKFLSAKKPNVLIKNNLSFENIVECRILFAMIARIGKVEKIDQPFLIDITEIVETGKYEAKLIKDACRSLAGRVIDLEDTCFDLGTLMKIKKRDYDEIEASDNFFRFKGILVSIARKRKSNMIEACFSSEVANILKNMHTKGGYTMFALKYILPIKSIYSLRIYEILRMNLFKKVLKISLGDFKNAINAVGKSYENFFELERTILKPAKKNIETFTDIKFTYVIVQKKSSRKVEMLEFKISSNVSVIEKRYDEPTDEEKNKNDKHVKIVKEYIWQKDQEEILKSNSPDKIIYYYNLTKELEKKGMVLNFKAFFYSSLTKDVESYEERMQEKMKTEQEKEKEREEKMRQDEINKLNELKEFEAKEKIFNSLPNEEQDKLFKKAPKHMTPKQKYDFAVMNLPTQP